MSRTRPAMQEKKKSSLFSLSFTPCPPGTLDSSFLLSFPSLVPPCPFAPDLSLLRPLHASLLWPPWAYCPARHFLLLYALSYLSPPALLPLSAPLLPPLCPSFLLHLSPASSSSLEVFAQSGSAQRGNTLRSHDPKCMPGAFRAGAAYDLQTSSCRLSYVPPTVLVPTILLDAADHLLLYYVVSWHPPHIEVHACYTTAFILPISVLLF